MLLAAGYHSLFSEISQNERINNYSFVVLQNKIVFLNQQGKSKRI